MCQFEDSCSDGPPVKLGDVIDEAFWTVLHSALHHVIERDGLHYHDPCFMETWAEEKRKILRLVGENDA